MNLERLRALHAIATHGSVGAAADALHVTAPAVSQAVAKLEREVGQRLVERNGRGVRLTDAANRLVGHAAEILSLVERAEADMEAHRDGVVGKLIVAAFPTAARGMAPMALRALRDAHRRLSAELREMDPEPALVGLVNGEVDVAISQSWEGAPLAVPDSLTRRPLLDDVADLALPAEHRLAGRADVDISELTGETWVSWPHGCMCRGLLVHTLRSLGEDPVIAYTANEHATQLELVAAGLGLALIPRLGRGPVPEEVRLVPVRPLLRRQVYALWRTDTGRRPAIRATVDAFAAVGDSLASGGSKPGLQLAGEIQ